MRGLVCLLAFSLPSALLAGDGVLYELRPGSLLIDDCFACDRVAIERPLEGTFLLQPAAGEPGSTRQDLSEIRFAEKGGEYTVVGSGSLSRSTVSPFTEELVLDVEVNGVPGIQLRSKEAAPDLECRPSLEASASEGPERDPLHIYTVRLSAAPRAEYVRYELEGGLDGSILIHECLPCARPTVPIPLTGSFLLGIVEANPLFVTYRLEAIDFRNEKGPEAWRVTGGGCYRQGGEVALLQAMELKVAVNQTSGVLLTSGMVPVERKPPEIDIQLTGADPNAAIFEYQLRIVARPAGSTPFRRGDSNGDGKLDLSDAVYILWWRFAGATTPACLEAADSNGDAGHDLSDAVYLLLYLFRGGDGPPAPGPDACGPAPSSGSGCESYAC